MEGEVRLEWLCYSAAPLKSPKGLYTPARKAYIFGGRFGYFFCSGEGEVRGDREGGGVGFLLKIPGRGGVSQEGGGNGGGGAKYSFSGPKCPPST